MPCLSVAPNRLSPSLRDTFCFLSHTILPLATCATRRPSNSLGLPVLRGNHFSTNATNAHTHLLQQRPALFQCSVSANFATTPRCLQMDSQQGSRPHRGTQCLATDLEKPLLDDRAYKVIQLPNKLEALLIHDPDTDKASAALDVNAGSLSDDDALPGMAHAVEHLLFMGTEKVSVSLP